MINVGDKRVVVNEKIYKKGLGVTTYGIEFKERSGKTYTWYTERSFNDLLLAPRFFHEGEEFEIIAERYTPAANIVGHDYNGDHPQNLHKARYAYLCKFADGVKVWAWDARILAHTQEKE